MIDIDHCCLGVSFHLGNMGRAFLEPSTLSIFTPHLYPGIFFLNSNYAFTFHLQSLMTDKPYHNEPGYENERFGGDVKRFVLEWCVPALTDISLITGTI